MSIVRAPGPRSRRHGARPSVAALVALSAAVLVAVAGQGTALAAANPTMWNQASSSGIPAGGQIYDTVVLGGGVNPTGTLTFTLFGPANPTCAGAPIFTTTRAVHGNAYYESSRFTTNSAGTYSWIASYGGDAANHAVAPNACSTPSAQVMVGKRAPVLTVSDSWVPPSASETATLTSGAGPTGPKGTMTANVYGPNDMTCARPPVFTSVRTVTGNGSYVSGSFNPTVVGTYQWVVSYSGDQNNFARTTTCADTSNGFVLLVSTPVVSASPSTVARGGTITVTWSGIPAPTDGDWFALYASGTPDGGVVTAWNYTGGTASGSDTLRFPWGATAGTYELRLMADNDVERLATSGPITLVW